MGFFFEDIGMWIGFNLLILVLLGIDLFFHKNTRAIRIKEALFWSAGWIVCALIFNVIIYFTMGSEKALAFFTGYLIEKSLSVDNLFVFLLIFQAFRTPSPLLHKVLFWGVVGAILMRAIFIFLGITLLNYFHWVIYLFGFFLIVMGIKFAFEKTKKVHPENNPLILFFQRLFPITPDYVGKKFFTRRSGRLYATPLFLVLLAIESSDLIFAVDSIPVILGITSDPFIVYTSNIFAILGLRSLFFVLSGLMELFAYLHYALAAILVFIGAKMLFSSFISVPLPLTLGLIIFFLGSAITLSLLFPPTKP